MQPITSREIRLCSRPQERPSGENFELATVVMPPLGEGELLVRNTYLSVDPCMFCRMRGGKSYLPAFDYKAGSILGQLDDLPLLNEDTHDASLEAALGVCMVGSIVAETTPGVLEHGRRPPLPIYFISHYQEAI